MLFLLPPEAMTPPFPWAAVAGTTTLINTKKSERHLTKCQGFLGADKGQLDTFRH